MTNEQQETVVVPITADVRADAIVPLGVDRINGPGESMVVGAWTADCGATAT